MEETLNQRLIEFVKKQGIDEPSIYKRIGASRQTWSHWINNETAIPLQKVQRIIGLFPQLNARWLMTGEGIIDEKNQVGLKVYRNEEKMNQAEEPEVKKNLEDLRNYIKTQERVIEMQDEQIKRLKEQLGNGK